MVDVQADRTLEGLKATFIQFADTVFAGEPLTRRLSLEVAEVPAILEVAALTRQGQYPPYVLFAAVQFLLSMQETEPLADYYPSLRQSPLPPEGAFPLFEEFCARHEEELRRLVATRLVQTNEVGRVAVLAPAFAHVSRLAGNPPLHLIDIGAAAGLNLLFDRYRLDYGAFQWGDAASPVRIRCELRDADQVPLEGWQPNISHRIGVDLNPIDLTSETEARWLKSLARADKVELANLLSQAMAVATQDPPTVLQGDATALLPALLGAVTADETPCVYQSYALEYFPDDSRRQFLETLAEFGARRDLYFVEMAGPGERGRLVLTSWRNGEREEVRLADSPSHGQWLRWLV